MSSDLTHTVIPGREQLTAGDIQFIAELTSEVGVQLRRALNSNDPWNNTIRDECSMTNAQYSVTAAAGRCERLPDEARGSMELVVTYLHAISDVECDLAISAMELKQDIDIPRDNQRLSVEELQACIDDIESNRMPLLDQFTNEAIEVLCELETAEQCGSAGCPDLQIEDAN